MSSYQCDNAKMLQELFYRFLVRKGALFAFIEILQQFPDGFVSGYLRKMFIPSRTPYKTFECLYMCEMPINYLSFFSKGHTKEGETYWIDLETDWKTMLHTLENPI